MNPSHIVQDYEIEAGVPARKFRYRGVFIPSAGGVRQRCTLVLTGTSTQVADVAHFINQLWRQGGAVAAVERFIGGPLSVRIRPAVERPAAMAHFLERLGRDLGVERVDVVAHSYAAQEVVRVLEDRPASAFPRIGLVALINPSGFGNTRKFVPHCLHFMFSFLLRDYLRNLQGVLSRRHRRRTTRTDCLRAMRGILALALKTGVNPVRTFREVSDIVTSDMRTPLRRMVEQGGFRLLVVLSRRDGVVSADRSRDFFRMLPTVSCLELPGNHMDPLLHDGCVQSVLAALRAGGLAENNAPR